MFSTLSYCFGFTSHELNSNSSKEIDSPAFITEDVEDQWTLVELDDSSNDKGRFEYLIWLHSDSNSVKSVFLFVR